MHKPGLSSAAFYTLLLVALMMGANHVAARFAFNHGVDVATAVAFRSGITADDQVIINGLLRARPGQKVTPEPGTIGEAPATAKQ